MARFNTTFIYCPRSGDQVFVDRTGQDRPVVSILHRNGCRHVVGGVELSYWSAEPGAYCRDEARAMAQAIIEALDEGLAWDDCGNICLVVPVRAAYAAHRRMENIIRRSGGEDRLMRIQESILVEAGAACLQAKDDGRLLELAPRGWCELPKGPCLRVKPHHWGYTYSEQEDGETIRLPRVVYAVASVDGPGAPDEDLCWEVLGHVRVPPEWLDPEELATLPEMPEWLAK